MKRIISFILLLGVLLGAVSIEAGAYTMTRAIPSVKVNVVLSDIKAGEDLSADAGAYVTCPDSSYYSLSYAEWIDDVTNMKVGDQPRMKVVLEAEPKTIEHSSYDIIYLFRDGYNSNNVTVSKGELIAADIKNDGFLLEVTLRINPVTGTFDAPSSVSWSSELGTGSWQVEYNDSGYYDIICYRGSTTVKKLNNFHGNSYNFYPYMTKEGHYTLRVRTVPNPSNGTGKKSDFAESGTLYISASQVSNGAGQTTLDENGGSSTDLLASTNQYPNGTGNDNAAGWISSGGYTYFQYPNNSYARDEWLKLDGKWYRFDSDGHRITGWYQNAYGNWFYLDPETGAMKTGWVQLDASWYYLCETEGDNLGKRLSGWLTWNGNKYYFNDSGIMVTGWFQIDGKYHYFYPKDSSPTSNYGYMAVNTKIGEFTLDENGVWE